MTFLTPFQNTIAFATMYAEGGQLSLSGNTWTQFPFEPTLVPKKNLDKPSGATTFIVKVEQTGTYFVEFNFIAQDGDSKTYFLKPYVNATPYNTLGVGMEIKFFQQPTTQKYEVSTCGLFNLTKGDTLEWYIYVGTPSATDFYTNTLRMNIINLQQIGVH